MIWVALAAYNEENNIGRLLESLKNALSPSPVPLRVVVVDDGSKDRTAEIVQSWKDRLDMCLISQPNAGFSCALGRAVKTVLEEARDEDICVTMDADASHPAGLILKMRETLERGSDMVIASRFCKGGRMRGVPFYRECLSWGARGILSLLVGIPGVRDYSTAFRAYRVSLLREAFRRYPLGPFEGKGFAGIASALVRMSYLTRRITEVPLILRYDLKQNASGMRIGKTILGYLELIQRYRSGHFKPPDSVHSTLAR